MWFTLSLFSPFSVAKNCIFLSKKCIFRSKTAFFSRVFKILQNFEVLENWNFENFGLEEIIELVDLVKRFPMSIWLQKSASIQPRTSLLKFEGRTDWKLSFSLANRLKGGVLSACHVRYWSTGNPDEQDEYEALTKIDLRAQYLFFSFEVRTQRA